MLVSTLLAEALLARPVWPAPAGTRTARAGCAPTARLFSEEWMGRLGTATASKAKRAERLPASALAPGCVLVAEPGSFDHYFLESLVLLLEHGPAGSRGVLLNHETPWQVDEMGPAAALGPFAANPLFLGGDAGADTMVMVHGEAHLPGAREVGRGVHVGGVAAAVRAVEEGALPTSRFKFFYKSVEFLPGALDAQVADDLFSLAALSPAWLYGQAGQRSMWAEVRQAISESSGPGSGGGGSGGSG